MLNGVEVNYQYLGSLSGVIASTSHPPQYVAYNTILVEINARNLS